MTRVPSRFASQAVESEGVSMWWCCKMVGGVGASKDEWQLERVLDVIDPGLLPFCHADFDHVEAPGEVAGPQAFEPRIRPSLDQSLFFLPHRIESPDPAALAAGFDFDEKQQFSVAGDDVDLATPWPPVVSGEDLAALGPQPGAGDPLAEIADPNPVTRLAVRCRQAAG